MNFQELLDKQVPPWMRYLLVFAAFSFLGYAVDAYIIGIAGIATGLLAVIRYRQLERKARGA